MFEARIIIIKDRWKEVNARGKHAEEAVALALAELVRRYDTDESDEIFITPEMREGWIDFKRRGCARWEGAIAKNGVGMGLRATKVRVGRGVEDWITALGWKERKQLRLEGYQVTQAGMPAASHRQRTLADRCRVQARQWGLPFRQMIGTCHEAGLSKIIGPDQLPHDFPKIGLCVPVFRRFYQISQTLAATLKI